MSAILSLPQCINTLRPRQDGRHFPDDIFKSIFFNGNMYILIKISLNCVPKCPIDNIQALVQIMPWCRLGDKPLSEPMIVRLPTHICVTRPQWVKINAFTKTMSQDYLRIGIVVMYTATKKDNSALLREMLCFYDCFIVMFFVYSW